MKTNEGKVDEFRYFDHAERIEAAALAAHEAADKGGPEFMKAINKLEEVFKFDDVADDDGTADDDDDGGGDDTVFYQSITMKISESAKIADYTSENEFRTFLTKTVKRVKKIKARMLARASHEPGRKAAIQPTNAPAPKPVPIAIIIKIDGSYKEINEPKKATFNITNNNLEWAGWTYNPITGCLHGCNFCSAREIANSKRMEPYYPFQFEPVFHPYRLSAPANTPVPKSADPRDGRVFVGSMADLFGKWVPDGWIKAIFDACAASPEWEYLFLTKWPERYAQMPLLAKAWYGASIIQQSDVERVTANMAAFEAPGCVKWISMEPLLEPIRLGDLSWCDLVVIGGQTSTKQPTGFVPEFAPDFDWIVDIVNQCRVQGVPYYLKPNVGREAPGMSLPKMQPLRRGSV